MAVAQVSFPLRYDVAYPERLSRWLIFMKWLLAIPHLVILYVLGTVQGILTLIAFFAILFTKQYPRGLFDFAVYIQRWSSNVGAYIGLQRDEYPPFGGEAGKYPVTYTVDYPEVLSRWLIFVKWLLVIPHAIVLWMLYLAAIVAIIIAWFSILLTARYPRGLFDFAVGVSRWTLRVTAYTNLLRDEYPPFSLQ